MHPCPLPPRTGSQFSQPYPQDMTAAALMAGKSKPPLWITHLRPAEQAEKDNGDPDEKEGE